MKLPELDRLALTRSKDTTRLARGLALVDGFGFFILAAHSPVQASAAFAYLRQEMESLRKTPVGLRVIAAYPEDETTDTPVAFQTLTSRVLEPLLQPAQDVPPETLTIIDASPAPAKDRETWRILFQRANEVRNTLAAKVNGPLLLALPVGWEGDFALAAPDFWSVRSDVATLPPLSPQATEYNRTMFQTINPTLELPQNLSVEERSLLEHIESARQNIRQTDNDDAAIRALDVWIERLASSAMKRGNLLQAQEVYEELLKHAEYLADKNPLNINDQIRRVATLQRIGDLYHSAGSLETATAIYDDAIQHIDNLTKTYTDNTELEIAKFIITSKTCRILFELRKHKEALDITLELVAQTKISIKSNSKSNSYLYTLSLTMLAATNHLISSEDFKSSKSLCNTTISILNTIDKTTENSKSITKAIATAHLLLGEIFFRMKKYKKSLRIYTKTILYIKFNKLEEDNYIDTHNQLLGAQIRIADIFFTKNPRKAKMHYNLCLESAINIQRRSPYQIQNYDHLICCAFRLSHIARNEGDTDTAKGYAHQALHYATIITNTYHDHPAWEQREIECRNLIKQLESLPSPSPAAIPR